MNIALATSIDCTPLETPILSYCCPNCGYLLTLHQPDPELTDRFLARCDECKSWYLTIPDQRTLRSLPQL